MSDTLNRGDDPSNPTAAHGPEEEPVFPGTALAELASIPPTPSLEPVPVRNTQTQFYGHTGAQQGHPIEPPKSYGCPSCVDLERRVRAAFKAMGFEF